MRRQGLLVLLISSLAALAVVLALALGPILEVRIEGVVSVPPKTKVVDVRLTIDREEGSESFDLGEVAVAGGGLVARVVLQSYEGDFAVVVSGVLTLSGKQNYAIPMPCAIAVGEQCYRVMVLIPGYDTPMPVEEGIYRVTLNLSWRARGSGRFYAKLYLEGGAL